VEQVGPDRLLSVAAVTDAAVTDAWSLTGIKGHSVAVGCDA
jgi:hypothetical protein